MAKQPAEANFTDILDRPASEVERPAPLPAGSYACVIKGMPKHDVSSKKKTPYVEFTLQPQQAMEDVDQEALNAWSQKKDGTVRTLQDTTIRATYYKTEDALWRLKDFLKHCGFDEDSDESLRQMIDGTPGRQVGVFMSHEATQDGEGVFAQLSKTFKLD